MMKKLTIGIFMDDYFPSMNGVIMVMHNLAEIFAKNGHTVYVVVPKMRGVYNEEYKYNIIRIDSKYLRTQGYYLATPLMDRKSIKELMNIDFDIIHIHSPFIVGNLGVKIARKKSIPVIATMHSQFKMEFERRTRNKAIIAFLMKYTLRTFDSCDECIAVNNQVANVYVDYGIKKKPMVTYNATDMIYVKDDEEVNEKFNIAKDETVFLFVGRISILKNIDFLIEVLKILKDKKVSFKMLFVGPLNEDGKILRKLIKDKKMENDIIVTGKITDRLLLAKIYNRAKLFLFPSLFDSSSLVQIEAASQKTPTVFIKGAVTAATVNDNVNGFLAENDPEKFADRVIEILRDRKLYNKVRDKCYIDLYRTWDDLAKDTLWEYVKLIDKKKNT